MKHLNRAMLAGTLALLTVGPVVAAECALNYEQFEVGVPHTDLETCPSSIAVDGAFCRYSLVAETLTVFAFSEATDCLIKTQVFSDEQFSLKVD